MNKGPEVQQGSRIRAARQSRWLSAKLDNYPKLQSRVHEMPPEVYDSLF